MNTDGRRFCFKSPASASQRHHPSHHSSSCFIILKRIMIYQKNMIHSSHYSRFWNKQHIGWQDILRKRNGAQLRPASLPCRGAWFTMIIIFQRHFRIEVSPWVKPKGGENIHVVVVCVSRSHDYHFIPWLFNSFSLWEQGWISQKHGVCPCFGKGLCHNVPTACSKFFSMFSQSTCCTCFIMF